MPRTASPRPRGPRPRIVVRYGRAVVRTPRRAGDRARLVALREPSLDSPMIDPAVRVERRDGRAAQRPQSPRVAQILEGRRAVCHIGQVDDHFQHFARVVVVVPEPRRARRLPAHRAAIDVELVDERVRSKHSALELGDDRRAELLDAVDVERPEQLKGNRLTVAQGRNVARALGHRTLGQTWKEPALPRSFEASAGVSRHASHERRIRAGQREQAFRLARQETRHADIPHGIDDQRGTAAVLLEDASSLVMVRRISPKDVFAAHEFQRVLAAQTDVAERTLDRLRPSSAIRASRRRAGRSYTGTIVETRPGVTSAMN